MLNIFEQIIASSSNKICVIAAPGGGKTTRILLPKLKKVLELGVKPEEILLLTFSRISATDLRKKLDSSINPPRASTVHSVALSFLMSENNHDIRSRIESILFDFEKNVLISDLNVIFPNKNKRILKKMLSEFSAGWAIKPHDQVFEENEERRSFKNAVIRWLEEHKAVMMEEVVYHAVQLAHQLTDAPFIAKPKYIFVDEFQDLNELEQQFVKLIAKESQLLLVVGDPNQSIYSFKYAHPSGIEDFAQSTGVETYRHNITTRCAKDIARVAADLIRQSHPDRSDILVADNGQEDGEMHFLQKDTQDEEFNAVLSSIAVRLNNNKTSPKDILVLTPKKKIGKEFANYVDNHKNDFDINSTTKFKFVLKSDPNTEEQKALLLIGALAKPDTILRARVFAGIEDKNYFAKEFLRLKKYYGSLEAALRRANPDNFLKAKQERLRKLCKNIVQFREFLSSHSDMNIDDVLNEILPKGNDNLAVLRSMCQQLKEAEDSIGSLYEKIIEYMRNIPAEENIVRVMTIMASKGLDSDHVYILGINNGNMPGQNRSEYLNDQQYKDEQRRLLYVGFTRAKRSLTVSWSRYIPFHDALNQYTTSNGTKKINGQTFSQVGLSEFLQDIPNIKWE